MIPFAQPSIFSLDDKILEDEEDGKQKSRPDKRSLRPTLILEEEADSVTVIFIIYSNLRFERHCVYRNCF